VKVGKVRRLAIELHGEVFRALTGDGRFAMTVARHRKNDNYA
jgi:hypothetical protein